MNDSELPKPPQKKSPLQDFKDGFQGGINDQPAQPPQSYAPVSQIATPNPGLPLWFWEILMVVLLAFVYYWGHKNGYQEGYSQAKRDVAQQIQQGLSEMDKAMRQSVPPASQ